MKRGQIIIFSFFLMAAPAATGMELIKKMSRAAGISAVLVAVGEYLFYKILVNPDMSLGGHLKDWNYTLQKMAFGAGLAAWVTWLRRQVVVPSEPIETDQLPMRINSDQMFVCDEPVVSDCAAIVSNYVL